MFCNLFSVGLDDLLNNEIQDSIQKHVDTYINMLKLLGF